MNNSEFESVWSLFGCVLVVKVDFNGKRRIEERKNNGVINTHFINIWFCCSELMNNSFSSVSSSQLKKCFYAERSKQFRQHLLEGKRNARKLLTTHQVQNLSSCLCEFVERIYAKKISLKYAKQNRDERRREIKN